ncbi:MAG: hypothetical protein AAFO95_11320 [Cyanobacteria bacterium J06600_6]
MAINYKDIRSQRQWKASTGLSQIQFEQLVSLFSETYKEIFDERFDERDENSTNQSAFKTYEDLLFYGLYSFKSGLSFDLLALSFGISSSTAYQYQSLVIRVLESTLLKAGHLPARAFNSEDEFKAYLKEETSILIDVTEQRIQRSANQADQKSDYSGKKKPIR